MRSRNFLFAGFSSILAAFVASACATAADDGSGDSTTDLGDSGTATGNAEASTGSGNGGGGGGDVDASSAQDSAIPTCNASGACTTNPGAPCATGTLVCGNDGKPTCIDDVSANPGTPCQGTGMCNGHGTCVGGTADGGGSCTAGGACSSNAGAPCKTGVVACNGNASSCVDNGNASAGTSCGGSNTCDGNGNCVAPDGGSACTPGGACSTNPGAPCKTGAVVCNGGVASCGDNGNAPAGTSCGVGQVCDGSGACVGASDGGGGTCHVVVNEVQTGGAASASDEWVEIFNPCNAAVDLTGFKLVYRSAAGTTDVALASLSGSLAAGGYRLYTGSAYTGAAASDGTMSAGLSGTAGGVAVRDGNGTVVDSMGYGAATNAFVETAPTVAPAAAQSVGRSPNGHDSNSNTTDFKLYTTPSPKAANP